MVDGRVVDAGFGRFAATGTSVGIAGGVAGNLELRARPENASATSLATRLA
jgi:hypothetical protein